MMLTKVTTGRMDPNGFTLVEILVVVSISILITIPLVTNFSRSKLDLDRSVAIFAGQIRELQSRAASGAKYQTLPRCGYGIHYDAATTNMMFYAGSDATPPADCSATDRNFNGPPEDLFIEWVQFAGPDTVIKQPFADIFFEPPDPKTYLNNNPDPSGQPVLILLGSAAANCGNAPGSCRAVCVYASGKIELPKDLNCPVR